MGAFGRGLVKLEVPVTDVGTDGEICLSEASCSPSVPAFNPWRGLPSFPYPLERSPEPSSIPAEYVSEIPCFRTFCIQTLVNFIAARQNLSLPEIRVFDIVLKDR